MVISDERCLYFFPDSGQWIAVSLIVLGFFVEAFVSIVTLMSYCAQCELLTFYLREICQRMEEKTKDLSALMKVITALWNILETGLFKQWIPPQKNYNEIRLQYFFKVLFQPLKSPTSPTNPCQFWVNPFTPNYLIHNLVILLTVCHTILSLLVWKIWYWINW